MKTFQLVMLCGLFAAVASAQTQIHSHTASGADVWGTAVDSAGNTVVSGKLTGSIDLAKAPASYIVSGNNAMFVAKYDDTQNLLWAHVWTSVDAGYVGSPNTPQIGSEGVAVDAAGNVYIVGYFRGRVDFDPGTGVNEITALDAQAFPAANAPFLLKLSPTGTFDWARSWLAGGGSAGGGIGLGVTCRGNRVYVNGIFGPDIMLDPENHTEPATSYSIATFVCVLTDTGSYVWATGFASYLSLTLNLTPDASGGLLLALSYIVDIQIGHLPGSPQFFPTGNADTLVLRYDATGNLSWMAELSGVGANVVGTNSAMDAAGNYYIAGQWRNSADFDPGSGTEIHTSTNGDLDGFVVKLDPSGDFVWFRKTTGSSDVDTYCVAVDGPAVMFGGSFSGTIECDSGPGSKLLTGGPGWMTRMDLDGNHVWSASYSSTSTSADADDNLLLVGGGDTWRWVDTTAPLHIYTPAIQDAQEGVAATAEITAVAGSDSGYNWSLVSGALPPGINGLPSASTPTLTLSGTPSAMGTYSFRVRVEDSDNGSDERDFLWTVTAPLPLAINVATITPSGAGSLASHTFSATGGTGVDYNWSLVSGTLPPGVNGIPGVGTPTITASGTAGTAGSYSFRLRVEDSGANSDERDFVWDITPSAPLEIAAATIPVAAAGSFASHTFAASGGSGSGYSWSVVSGALPSGIFGIPGLGTPTIDASGTPSAIGTFNFRLRVEDSLSGSHERDFTWEVVDIPDLIIQTPTVIASVVAGDSVNATITATGGSGVGYSWTLVSGALPDGVSGIPGLGTPSVSMNGIATTAGNFNFRVRVEDGIGNSDEQDFTWTVTQSSSGSGSGGAGGGGGCVATGGGSLALLALPALLLLRRRRDA